MEAGQVGCPIMHLSSLKELSMSYIFIYAFMVSGSRGYGFFNNGLNPPPH